MRLKRSVALAVLLALAPIHAARAADGCADGGGPGGDWPIYGRDFANTRNQEATTGISTANAGALAPAWTFSSTGAGGDGNIHGNAVTSGGCVFLGTDTGWVF